MTDRDSETNAADALRARGITDPERLVSSTDPTLILAHCEWWDQQKNAKPGLLVWRIRTAAAGLEKAIDGPPPGSKRAAMRATFAEIVQHYPEGSIPESHRMMAKRRWPDDEEECAGAMVVVEEPTFPSLVVRCDGCGFEAAYPFKALAAGVLPPRPPVDPRPVPGPQPQVPREQWRRPADRPATRDLYPAQMDARSLRWRR
jgi:hypothetical protein